MDDCPDNLFLSFLSLSSSSAPKPHPLSPSSTVSVCSSPYPHSPSLFSSLSFSSSSSSLPNQLPLPIDEDLWGRAEQKAQEILSVIQPALVSEERRKNIIDYVRRLIKCCYAFEVFPFGSVPLKTYLPDGDIDLTAMGHQNMEEDLAKVLCSIVDDDQKDSEFVIQDVQYIPAQVKIVKCIISNVPVDISFNQMAGLSALCFLEKVDQLVGKDHLFKRSITLIKAWCYYESRILGAHHGLISTYALEMLVLCIINLFHSSLCGPLAVLHKFLEYFGTFDWDNCCVTINGPVALSSLPECLVYPENGWNGRLLSQNFLSRCREAFSVPLQAVETACNDFPIKHMNIVDPLKGTNNLGRSVSKGNFYRIRCAFSYGFQRLDEIFILHGESVGMQLEKFFVNTLDRNGRGQRPDVLGPVPIFGRPNCALSDLSGDYNSYYNWLLYGLGYHNYTLHLPNEHSFELTPSRTPTGSSWESLPQFLCIKQNLFYHRGPEVFSSRLPFSHCSAPKLLPPTFGLDESRKSRGTGTFIPSMTRIYREKDTCERERSSGSAANVILPESPHSDRIQDPVETGTNCPNLSLEQFPLLPGGKMPVTLNQSSEPTLTTLESENCSHFSHDTDLGMYENLPFQLAAEQSDFQLSVTMADLLSVPTVGTQERQDSIEIEGQRSLIPPYQLKDSDEFPPLSTSMLAGDEPQGAWKRKLSVNDKLSNNARRRE